MRRLTLATIAVLLVNGLAAADFKTGLEAYERGDYATAVREWQPLAEKGDAPVTARSETASEARAWIATPKSGVPRAAGFICAIAPRHAMERLPARIRTRRAGCIA